MAQFLQHLWCYPYRLEKKSFQNGSISIATCLRLQHFSNLKVAADLEELKDNSQFPLLMTLLKY